MNLPTISDKLASYTDLAEHFSEQWRLHGKQASTETNTHKQSILVRQVGLERGISVALQELIQITKNN